MRPEGPLSPHGISLVTPQELCTSELHGYLVMFLILGDDSARGLQLFPHRAVLAGRPVFHSTATPAFFILDGHVVALIFCCCFCLLLLKAVPQ